MTKMNQIHLTKSLLRSYAAPIFTPKQFAFFLSCLVCSLAVAIAEPRFGGSIGAILIAACLGALSISSPAVLQTDDSNLSRIEDALRAGGWQKRENGTWHSEKDGLWSWENDEVRIASCDGNLSVFGPLYTLRRLRVTLRSKI